MANLTGRDRIAINTNFGRFAGVIRSHAAQMPGVASALAKRATLLLATEIVQGGQFAPGTPVDTGAARNSWTALPDGVGSAKPFTPQRAPDQNGDAAMALIQQTVEGSAPNVTTFVLASSCPYMIPLEYGHSQGQAPTGMIRNALAGWDQIVSQAVADVRDRLGTGFGNDWGGGDGGGDGGE